MHNDDLYDDIIGLAELELGVSANNSTEANGNLYNYVSCSNNNNALMSLKHGLRYTGWDTTVA